MSSISPNKLMARAEQLVAEAGAEHQVVVVVRIGDRIDIRDNSGIEGLTGEPLLQKTVGLLDELFKT